MSQNNEQKQEKKRFPLLSAFIALLVVLAVTFFTYFALFPQKKAELSNLAENTGNYFSNIIEEPLGFLSREKENTLSSILPPETPQNIPQPPQRKIQEPKQEQPEEPQKNSNYQTANEIFEKLTNPEKPIVEEEKPKTIPSVENLPEVDMSQKDKNTDTAALQGGSDDFSLQAPQTISPLESGRRMLTEEEIRRAQAQEQREKLAKLEALRREENNLTEEEKNSLPNQQGTLKSLVPDDSFDPVVTLFFIQDLAKYLVDNYKINKRGQGYSAVTMPRLNQRYGVGLIGLEHAKGRAGVLEYAYHANMIPLLYEKLSPLLLKAMKLECENRNMTETQTEDMFRHYGNLSATYAYAVRELLNIPQLSENIQNLITIENDLKTEEDRFAENLLSFEQNRENPSLAVSYEENIRLSTIRSEQLRLRVSRVKSELLQYLADYDKNLSQIPDILPLALWLERRNNPAAGKAFANALDSFAGDCQQAAHNE